MSNWRAFFRDHGCNITLKDIKNAVNCGYDVHTHNDVIISDLFKDCIYTSEESLLEILKYLIEDKGCKMTPENSHAVIQCSEKIECLKYLIKNGANPNYTHNMHIQGSVYKIYILKTALNSSLKNEMIPYLLKNGADPTLQNQKVLETAYLDKDKNAVSEFIKYGCDFNAQNGAFFLNLIFEVYHMYDIGAEDLDSVRDYIKLALDHGARPLQSPSRPITLIEKSTSTEFHTTVMDCIYDHMKNAMQLNTTYHSNDFADLTMTGLRRKVTIGTHGTERGLIHAARSGQLKNILLQALLNSDGTSDEDSKIFPMDFLYCDAYGNRVIDYIGELDQASHIFTPELWQGRLRIAGALHETMLERHKSQINMIDLRHRCRIANTPSRKPLKRRPKAPNR